MRRYILSLLLCCISSLAGHAQIPNASFEEWTVGSHFESPSQWTTNQDIFIDRLARDTISTDGIYALRIEPSPLSGFAGCSNIASISVPLDAPLPHNQSLYFDARIIPDSLVSSLVGSYLRIIIRSYDNEDLLNTISWERREITPQYQRFEIPLENDNANLLTITIIGGGVLASNDPCIFRSTAWIDYLRFDTSSPVSAADIILDTPAFSVFPNPSAGTIFIKPIHRADKYFRILNTTGKIVQEGPINLPHTLVELDAPGLYWIQLVSLDGKVSPVAKVIVVY